MTVGEIPTAGRDRKILKSFNFNPFSRTLIAITQMVGDGLLLVALSYLSLNLVAFARGETVYMNYFAYTAYDRDGHCPNGHFREFRSV
jgi:hypothetical protein